MENQNLSAGAQKDALKFIFFNPRGLRPGWRLLIFVGLFSILSYAISFLNIPRKFTPSWLIVNETLAFGVAVFCSWVMSRIERRNMAGYGLPLRDSGALPRFVRGYVFWGFLPLTILLLLLRMLHAFYFGTLALHRGAIFSWGMAWAVLFVLVGLTEEYSFRGYILYTLTE
ncbi:MAG TPA: hypothetical protein VJA94_09150, partial [Candidatus Angelobacter sp.]